jgi:hypothetical protein
MRTIDLWRQVGGSTRCPETLEFAKVGVALVDDQDFPYVNQWRWGMRDSGYARRMEHEGGKAVNVMLHNVIAERMGIVLLPGQTIDHRDRDPHNCQRYNLRPASNSLQGTNKKVKSTSRTGVSGVTWEEGAGKWRARITFQQNTVDLGCYADIDEAIKVRKRAEIERLQGMALMGEAVCT